MNMYDFDVSDAKTIAIIARYAIVWPMGAENNATIARIPRCGASNFETTAIVR